jgi:hypothetical protein
LDVSLLHFRLYVLKPNINLNMLCLFAEGIIMAIEHPGIAAGSTAAAGIVLFKSKSRFFGTRWLCGIMLDDFSLFVLQ